MEAKCICPNHGRLDLDDVIIKNGIPICRKCLSALEFGKVRPRMVESSVKSAKSKKPDKDKRLTKGKGGRI